MIPKEFERSNLAFELKAGKKRLELVLHGLTDEQCGMAGAVRSDSISELVSHVIKNEFLALNEAYERLSGSDKQSSGVERHTRFVDRRRHSEPRSIQSLLAEFEVVRSAIIRLVEQGGGNNAHYELLQKSASLDLTNILNRSNDGEIPSLSASARYGCARRRLSLS